MKFAVIVFTGSNCDNDAFYALKKNLTTDVDFVWHKEASLNGFDAILIPGGFSYGDYLITGANVIEGLLLWTDNQTEPKKIKISSFF